MSDAGFHIEPTVLERLGCGDTGRGLSRLRLMIADAKPSVPVVGPTERPSNVRAAQRSDESMLEELLLLDAAENAVSVAPASPDDIRDLIRAATRGQDDALIGVIDGPSGEPVAAVGIFLQKWWWSSAFYLMEQFTFVHPEHRRSTHARNLVLFARWVADEYTRQLGYQVYLMHGVTSVGDQDRKVRLLKRLSNYVGSLFLYPLPPKEISQ